MLVAVAGGNLQGVEAAYLAVKAGWEVIVIDRNQFPPASGLCNSFIQLDITKKKELAQSINGADLIIPALENDDALVSLCTFAKDSGIPMMFDLGAYKISSSKIKSNSLFAQAELPAPKIYPKGNFPFIAKPDKGSGSNGVQIFYDSDDLKTDFPNLSPSQDLVIQEYISGPSYSLEIIGSPGQYTPLQVTDLFMDKQHDCKRVTAPSMLSQEHVKAFKKTGIRIAESIKLHGLMDVEVILHDGILKLLEIDARLPSQTPAVVFWSTGFNIVQQTGAIFLDSITMQNYSPDNFKHVIYEHIHVSADSIEIAGEHIMSGFGPLHVQEDFFGADEAITSFSQGSDEWVATLINTGANRYEAWEKRNTVLIEICSRFDLHNGIIDHSPEYI